ncbi:MAG: TonB-dependent receptor [Gemmatimonadetes bacterium]|nr:TonB-dependent receptor [Gemmatimonadota bacterium]
MNRILRRAFLIFALAGGLTPVTVAALQQPDTVIRIGRIEVQGQRPATTVGGASALEIELDSLAVPAAASVEEVFRQLPGIHVRTNSRGEAEIAVRGSESRQVAVLLDGAPITLGWDARADVSILPAGAVTDITLIRGLSSLLHGPNVLGGIVEMRVGRSADLSETASVSATGGLDSEGGFGASAVAYAPFETDDGEGGIRFGAGFRDSPGFVLPGAVTEPVATDDDLRLNTDRRNLSGFLAGRFVGDGGAWAALTASTFGARRGIAAELGADEPRLWRYPSVRRTIVAASTGTGDRDTPLGRGDLELSVSLDDNHTEIESFATRAYDQVVGTEIGDGLTTTARLLGDHSLGQRGELSGAFTYSDIRHEADENGQVRSFQQRLTSLAVETAWRLVDDPTAGVQNVRLSLGGAWDRGTTPRTGGLESLGTIDDWGGRVGLSAVVADGAALVHAGISRRGRFPSLRETYSESLDRFVPNPDLSPEHLLAAEAGVTLAAGDGEVQIVGFRHRLNDAIRRITFEDGRRMRVNSERLVSTGLEVMVSQSIGPVLLGGDLTLQSVTLTDPGTSISSEPENLPETDGRLFAQVPLLAHVSGSIELDYTGSQFCQDPNTGADVELDGGSWWNATLSRLFQFDGRRGRRSVQTRLLGRNLGDQVLYDQCGLPRAGRSFEVQIRVF